MSAPAEQKLDTSGIAKSWLSSFAALLSPSSISKSDPAFFTDKINALFLPNAWLRDSLALSWDPRSLSGHSAISSYVSANLGPPDKTTNLTLPGNNLDPGSFIVDAALQANDTLGVITPAGDLGAEFGFWFKGDIIIGRGYARLLRDDAGTWRALTVYLATQDLVGHEEMGPEDGTYDGHRLAWKDVKEKRTLEVEKDPDVVVVGAGHCGLNIAAVLQQNGLKTLIIEKNDRVGDSWRKRYPTLSLHTIKSHSALKYQEFPKNWPVFTPRDKIADWMEQYARIQDLCVWTRSTIVPKARYNAQAKRWDIMVDHDGSSVILHPKHLVFATGFAHEPIVPHIPAKEEFKGMALHSSMWRGAGEGVYAGKHVVVVGAGNTAADICQDLYTHISAANTGGSVTMVQRSSTCVVSRDSVAKKLGTLWPLTPGTDVGLCDFKAASLPFGLLKKWEIANEANAWKEGEKMYEGLRKVGFQLNMGKEGAGQYVMVYERGGGYWLDVGCAELLSSKKVGLKQGDEIVKYTPDGLVFSDGSSLPADVVIFATGYKNGAANLEELFGSEVMSHVSTIGGVDGEGERAGVYRQSGYPGLWFTIEDFGRARSTSKQLTMLIKAVNLGWLSQEVPGVENA